jgi:hypothetical protein
MAAVQDVSFHPGQIFHPGKRLGELEEGIVSTPHHQSGRPMRPQVA